MEFFGPALIVFAILIGVAIAAISFEPASPLQQWHRLMERYGTQDQPPGVQFRNQAVLFGGRRGGLQPLNPFVRFDATIDDFGLWLVCRGPDDQKLDAAIKVPGTHVRPASRRVRGYQFELFAEPPVRIAVDADLGAAIEKKSQSVDTESAAVEKLGNDEQKPR
jgi:hypothetical protein